MFKVSACKAVETIHTVASSNVSSDEGWSVFKAAT